MNIRNAMEEAFHRGEKIKDQFLEEVMNSETVNGLLHNEYFLKSLTKVLNTKYELKRAFKTNFKTMLKAFNVPSRDEIHSMERKIHRLETEIDGIQRKVLSSRLAKAKKAGPKKGSHSSHATKKS